MKSQLLVISVLFFLACSQNNKPGSKEELSQKIESFEDTLYNQDNFAYLNDALVKRTITTYENYAGKYEDDELAPEYLFKAANLYRYKRKFFEALALYEKIEMEYPEYDKAPQSLFLRAFIYENELGDLEKARELYELFLEKYPDDAFAKDARHCLENLGRPLEDIIKEFEGKNTEESS